MCSAQEKQTVLSSALRRFQDYVGLKLHFNSDLIQVPEFKPKLTERHLMSRKDAFVFFDLADRFSREENIQIWISLFKQNQKGQCGNVLEEEYKEYHKDRLRIINSIKYSFRTDIERLKMFMLDNKIDVKTLLKSDGQSPYIIANESDIIGGVTDETLALLDRAFKFTEQETIDPLWDQRKFSLRKYGYLVEIDKAFYHEQLGILISA